jgi:hypothetical protein
MALAYKFIIGGLAILAAAVLVLLAWYFLGKEARERRAVLNPLLSTNASLVKIRAEAGEFVI